MGPIPCELLHGIVKLQSNFIAKTQPLEYQIKKSSYEFRNVCTPELLKIEQACLVPKAQAQSVCTSEPFVDYEQRELTLSCLLKQQVFRCPRTPCWSVTTQKQFGQKGFNKHVQALAPFFPFFAFFWKASSGGSSIVLRLVFFEPPPYFASRSAKKFCVLLC